MWDTLSSLPEKLTALVAAFLLILASLRGPPPGASPQKHSLTPPYQLELDFDSWTREERRQEAYRRASAYRARKDAVEQGAGD